MTPVLRSLAALIVFISIAGNLRAADVASLVKKFPALNATERDTLSADLFSAGPAGIQAISAMLTEPTKGGDTQPRLALEGMAIHASRPGNDVKRKLFAQTVASELSGTFHPQVKVYLLIQLRITAGDEQVADIAKLLTDTELSDHAAQTLLTIRTPSVASALRTALATLKDGPRVTVINALGALRDTSAAADILKDASSADVDIRNAALRALAAIGDSAVAPAMAKAASVENWNDRNQALQSALALAQRLVELGKKSDAASVCRTLMKSQITPRESHLQCAALNILASAESEAAFDDLKAALKSESPEVRATATALAASMLGAPLTLRWAAELKGADPKFAVDVLGVLERREDASAFSAIADAAKHANATVRAAAFKAAAIGGKTALPLLLTELSHVSTAENADERAAARSALTRVKGDGVNAALAAALNGASVNLKKVIISALSERNAVAHVSDVLALTSDADSGIRADAFESVGKLGGVNELAVLLKSVVKTDKDDERASAEKALIAIAAHTDQKSNIVTPVAGAMVGASVKARQSLLRVLGKTGGADALAALKPSLKDADADIVDTAVRELAGWPDGGAQADLLDVAKTAATVPHHVLAILGYVRLVEAESKRPTNDFLPRYKLAMDLCRRPDEKKKIISAMQNVKTLEGAQAVQALMADDTLREEACNAAINIAKELARSKKEVARAIFEKVLATAKRPEIKKNAQTELEKLGK
ncbi:MAG: HEAT repeat domain-containing protein [Planctomycetota bacterium]